MDRDHRMKLLQRVPIAIFGFLFSIAGIMGCAPPIPHESTPRPVEAYPLAALAPCPPAYCWRGTALTDLDFETVAGLVKDVKGYQDVEFSNERNEGGYGWYRWDIPGDPRYEPRSIDYVAKAGEFQALTEAFPSVSIGDVIAQFGEPSHVLVHPVSGPSSGDVGFTLFYEDKGLVFYSDRVRDLTPGSAFAVPPSATIYGYTVTTPTRLSELAYVTLLATSVPLSELSDSTESWLRSIQAWHGYTTYEVQPWNG